MSTELIRQKPAIHKGKPGFTLLEVMAALAILTLFLVPIMGSIVHGLNNVSRIQDRSLALRLAQNKMAQIEMMEVPEVEGVEEGDFEEHPGFFWEIESIKTPDLELMEEYIGIKGMEIHLRVIWERAGVTKSIELQTLLLE